ncbi:MAG: hypothetical protein RLY86_2711 [Pseudomonadota bacterium]|jgi:Rod binding domain-containing protein
MSDLALPTPGIDRSALLQGKAQMAGRAAARGNEAKIAESAKEFEAVFITQMLNSMWEGLGADEMFGGGQAEETFRGLLMDQYGKQMAGAGGFGLAAHVQRSLLEAQEKAANGGM